MYEEQYVPKGKPLNGLRKDIDKIKALNGIDYGKDSFLVIGELIKVLEKASDRIATLEDEIHILKHKSH